MKVLPTLIFVISSYYGYSQGPNKPVSKWRPVCFLDSVNLDLQQLYFDPNKIAKIHVDDHYYDSSNQIQGKIFITSKDKKDFHFLPISEIAKTYKNHTNSTILFMVDAEILKDISSAQIDSSYILKVQVTNGSEIDYLKESFPGLTVFRIITRTKENIDKEHQIRIRGTGATSKR